MATEASTAAALPPHYRPQEHEAAIYRRWEMLGLFGADPDDPRPPYVIVIPPPNVTSRLHMGHGLNNTVQDVLIRWRRMQGYNALWIPGTDHAGIATQNVVERQLAKEGRTRQELGRDAFLERVWAWVRQTGGEILQQLRALGCSCDWSRTRFTLDPGLSRAVREVFVRLYEEGLVYRGRYIIHWCPRCLTALSDEEATPEEVDGQLYYLRYPLADGEAPDTLPRLPDGRPYLVVATTRPETMLGDTAVAVHPEDPRYRALIGRDAVLPLVGRRLPIVADEAVDPEFGTGAVKVTPAHDPLDFAIAQRHGLPEVEIFTPEARLTDAVPPPFRGLDRFEARRAVVAALDAEGLLEGVRPHRHSVPHCYRCDTVVEPRLSWQWFVRMRPLAEPALAAAREGKVRFVPDRFTKIYEHWLENIRDWCISRQLWWGHRIPAWTCTACGQTVVAREDPARCPHCGSSELEQDPDVLDTWFSSWLWPFSTLGWPDATPELRTFYPTSTLVSGHDILFFWIARMIMAGLHFTGQVPFRDVYLTGIVRDHLGRKMSKSLGNGIDPLEVIERFGADALRYTVVAGAGAGMDQYLNYEDLEEAFGPGRNFANKLWNLGRFALLNLGEAPRVPVDAVDPAPEDRWILSRLATTVRDVTDDLERYRLQEAALTLHAFLWRDVADWYVEMIKGRLRGAAGSESAAAARAVLAEVLDVGLRLLHPIMPFITEVVWLRLPKPEGAPPSVMVAPWPTVRDEWIDAEAEARMAAFQELVTAVRALRAAYRVPPTASLELVVDAPAPELAAALEAWADRLGVLARVAQVRLGAPPAGPGARAVLRGGATAFLRLEGVVDVARERARLEEELARVRRQREAVDAKLANAQFRTRAPAEVVAREEERARQLRAQEAQLAAQLDALA